MNQEAQYILIDEAAEKVGVQRSTMYYYLKQLKMKPHKFPLDRRTYISLEELEEVKKVKQAAVERKH